MGPPAALQLTEDLIKNATGEDTLETLEEVEVIFNTIHEIGEGLTRCSALRSLSLINTGLRSIGRVGLAPVSSTLVRLCLCDQQLSSFDDVNLPQLRELFLHQNRITSLRGLRGCPRLQRLWVFSNRLTSLEGVLACGGLKELWAQDNDIANLDCVAGLPSLESLHMAGNPIADTSEIQKISGLVNLQDLCLVDIHFGRCPLTDAKGYRAVTLASLASLLRLDGIPVTQVDRRDSLSQQQAAELAFQQKVRAIKEQERNLTAVIESKRRTSVGHAAALRAEVSAGLVKLEDAVKSGWNDIAKESARREAVAQQALADLERSLQSLVEEYNREIDTAIATERAKMDREEILFAALEQRARATSEHLHALSNLKLHREARGEETKSVVGAEQQQADSYDCSELIPESAEFQHLSHQLHQNQKPTRRSPQLGAPLKLLAAHVVHIPHLAMKTREGFKSLGSEDLSSHAGHYFAHIRGRRLGLAFSRGLEGVSSSAGEPVILFSDPAAAFYLSPYGLGAAEKDEQLFDVAEELENATSQELGRIGNIVRFKFQGRESQLELRKLPAPPQCLADILATSGQNAPPASRVVYSTTDGTHGECLVIQEPLFSLVAPDACLLCGNGMLANDPADIERLLAEIAGNGSASGAPGCSDESWAKLKIRMQEALKQCKQYLEAGIGVDEARKLRTLEGTLHAKEHKTRQLRSDIEAERELQEQVLRSFQIG